MRPIAHGSTDQSVVIRILSADDGTPEEAVEHNTSGIAIWYRREGAVKTAISLQALSALNDAHADGGLEHIDDGYYRLDVPDAAFASGSVGVAIGGTVTGMLIVGVYVPLWAVNSQDAVRMGLTALPNAAAEASGGLPTLSAAQASNGTINANVHRWLTGTPNALQSGRVDSYLGAAAAGVIAAATFAANALDAVWSTAVRTLTTGTNIVLAKGTGVTGFNDLSAAQVNAEADTALADYDGPTNAELTTAILAVLTAIGALNNLSAAQVATALSNYAAAQPTQSYAAAGAVPTRDQFSFMILQMLSHFTITAVSATPADGATVSTKKLDGTEAMTHHLDNSATPTSRART